MTLKPLLNLSGSYSFFQIFCESAKENNFVAKKTIGRSFPQHYVARIDVSRLIQGICYERSPNRLLADNASQS